MALRQSYGRFFSDGDHIHLYEIKLELHGIFWFHTLAQPRDKYVHVSLPLIHNYPITIALLNRPVEEAYASISKITKSIEAKDIWEKHGFYAYPAVATKIHIKTFLFSMGGTGSITLKPRTRASVPDLTAHQVFLPGTIFKTYIIASSKEVVRNLPRFMRLGAKRYGVFATEYSYLGPVSFFASPNSSVTHPFNIKECPAYSYQSVMNHYAGEIAISGTPRMVSKIHEITLAAPEFLIPIEQKGLE
ncbi:MAG: hypothetical protein ACP5HH_07540 [Fervidicoccaceae archaeon]